MWLIGSVFNGGPYVGPVVAKEKVNSYFRRPEFGITVSASVLTYMHSVHAVMLKPASVHFTFISDYGYLI